MDGPDKRDDNGQRMRASGCNKGRTPHVTCLIAIGYTVILYKYQISINVSRYSDLIYLYLDISFADYAYVYLHCCMHGMLYMNVLCTCKPPTKYPTKYGNVPDPD